MLLEFKVKNFRSFKEEVVFSLIAGAYKSKDLNVFAQQVTGDEPVRLLKAAAIWGPNASGKTNLLKAMAHLVKFLRTPPDVEEEIRYYAPFLFAKETENEPVAFDLSFIGPEQIRFEYHLAFDNTSVTEESLYYYPKGRKSECFHRESGSGIIDLGIMGPDWKKKKYDVYKNQLFLSQFGKYIPDERLGIVYSLLVNIRVIDANDASIVKLIQRNLIKKLLANPNIKTRLSQLISKTDKLVDELEIRQVDKDSFKFPKDLPSNLIEQILEDNKYEIHGKHKYYVNNDHQGYRSLPIREESQGTQNLFALGGYLFEALEEGYVVFVDELDTSLHSLMAKLVCELFQNEITNPKNAQLIFTTHDTSLLDESMLRRDQIWFTEKNKFGISDLYSLQDIDGVREDSLFEKSYRAGKYSAIPEIPSINTIFSHD